MYFRLTSKPAAQAAATVLIQNDVAFHFHVDHYQRYWFMDLDESTEFRKMMDSVYAASSPGHYEDSLCRKS